MASCYFPSKFRPLLLLALPALLLSCLLLSVPRSKKVAMSKSGAEEEARLVTEIHGVKIEKSPPQSKLDELGVANWPKWGCGPSKFPWTFESTETMYLLEGKVIVYIDGHDGSFEIGGGDLVVFPKGMKIVWDVVEAVNKHYSLEKN
ncbi:uncharacterized protein LOC115755503 [Rhodamnia argentea]|uniref:Uncharacterized protein LOC115755503 n=1 Tax=Rhodamnia argentea TaxID=178133 RepID=A0A8B8QWU3_9MYRT|nr:uncharacterized protein LOC115755503 [Rhodamnia argentea]